MNINSPYEGIPEKDWAQKTEELVSQFPLSADYICEIVNKSWNDLYKSSIGESGLVIGEDIFLPAQATGVILEKIISNNLQKDSPSWRPGNTKIEKDVVNNENSTFSFEIKTSSSKTGLYGNRSTGHRSENRTKIRTGYYLVVNYKLPKEDDPSKSIYTVRFGWIDDEDWVGQAEPTGQQASIGVKLARLKLVTLQSNL